MTSFSRRLVPGLIVLVLCAAAACGGGASVEGTYANASGQTTLELKAGDQASFSVMGDTQTCTYRRQSSKLTVSCPGSQTFDFTVASDGTLTSEAASIGALKKK